MSHQAQIDAKFDLIRAHPTRSAGGQGASAPSPETVAAVLLEAVLASCVPAPGRKGNKPFLRLSEEVAIRIAISTARNALAGIDGQLDASMVVNRGVL